ncbi:hypothetical protein FPV67DRAFT_1090695 [Lyophyllum atratum]|nr:hypothetical protein FPV67DRAFT_1090695 [Lyophyllum atratum]
MSTTPTPTGTHLRVSAGPSLTHLHDITPVVNTAQPYKLSSDRFEGEVVAYIKGLPRRHGDGEGGKERERESEKEYFEREERRGVTWSIQVRGRFLHPISADDILFGNTFDRPLHLPWGSGAALKFMHYMDPTLEHDLTSPTKPWALSPLISTMPHFKHQRLPQDRGQKGERKEEPFPPRESIEDDTSQLHLAGERSSSHGSGNGGGAEREGLGLEDAAARRAYFSSSENRKKITFGPEVRLSPESWCSPRLSYLDSLQDVITTDFCYGFIEFTPTLSLRLPGGISFDLVKYWDGQPVRFMCCERKKEREGGGEGEGPWGAVFWCVAIEMVKDEEDEEGGAREEGKEAGGDVD